MITQPAPALPQTVYIVFSGQIDPMSVQRLINACTNATDLELPEKCLMTSENREGDILKQSQKHFSGGVTIVFTTVIALKSPFSRSREGYYQKHSVHVQSAVQFTI